MAGFVQCRLKPITTKLYRNQLSKFVARSRHCLDQCVCRVYPRSRGGTGFSTQYTRAREGLSPLARGNRRDTHD